MNDESQSQPAMPPGCRVRLIEATPDRLVLAIPAGGPKARSLGVMAFVWNAVMVGMTVAVVFAGFEFAPILFAIPFITLFLVCGIALAGAWVGLRFTRTNLLVTRGDLAIQKILWFHKSLQQTDLDEQSAARLVESYIENDKTVFKVEVPGIQHTAVLGTALSREDKDWLVATLNAFLEREPPEVVVRQKQDGVANAIEFEPLSPESLPVDTTIRVEQPSPGEIIVMTPAVPPGFPRLAAVGLALFVLMLWGGLGAGKLIVGGGTLDQIVGWAFLVIALAPVLVVAVALWGQLRVSMNERTFESRVHIGPLAYRVRRPTQTAERITVSANSDEPSDSSVAATVAQIGTSRMLCVWGPGITCRQVAGLVSHHFEKLGLEVAGAYEPDPEFS